MRARQLIVEVGLPPHALPVVLEAFEDAWAEIGPDLGADPMMIEATRLSLARVLLEIVTALPLDRGTINCAAVAAFPVVSPDGDAASRSSACVANRA